MSEKPVYRIAALPADEGSDRKPMRHNDGAMVIMLGGEDDEDTRPVLQVMKWGKAKRGMAWNTPDPEQEAFAAHVVALLNGDCHD